MIYTDVLMPFDNVDHTITQSQQFEFNIDLITFFKSYWQNSVSYNYYDGVK